MKRIAYSFLLIVLLSCGHSIPSSQNRITIQFRDSIITDYFLLSVRNNSLLVAPYTHKEVEVETLLATAKKISFNTIDHIYVLNNPNYGTAVLSGCGGGCIGAFATCNFSLGSDGGRPASPAAPYAIGGGFLTGFLVGYLLSNADKEYSTTDKIDMERLNSTHSLFRVIEPPELQKIK